MSWIVRTGAVIVWRSLLILQVTVSCIKFKRQVAKTTLITMSAEKPKLDLGVLEEDDEFEEFPVEGDVYSMYYDRIHLWRLSFLHQSCLP